MNSLISVIIPIYQSDKYLNRCIKSVVSQTYKNLEIILIDDGSTDHSPEICDQWEKLNNRILVIHKKNEGVSSARNIGLQIAKGDYITFIDSDDYVDANYCEVLIDAITKYHADISFCFSYDRLVKTSVEKVIDAKCYNCLSWDSHNIVWGGLFKKCVLSNQKFDTDLYVGEDTLFCMQAIKNSAVLVHTHKKLYHYIKYPNSACHGTYNIKKLTELESWRRICELYADFPKNYYLCKCSYACHCRSFIYKYCSEMNNSVYRSIVSEYRKNLKYCFLSHYFLPLRHNIKTLVEFLIFASTPFLYIKLKSIKDKILGVAR